MFNRQFLILNDRTAHRLNPVRLRDISRLFESNRVREIIESDQSASRLCARVWQKFFLNRAVRFLDFVISRRMKQQYP